MSDPKEPQLRVIDRRWWARQDADTPSTPEPTDEPRERKPTVVEDLESQLARAQEQLAAVLGEHRRASEEFEQVKARLRRDVTREVERGRRTVLVEMLEVVDNLDRAIAAARGAAMPDPSDTLLRGVELVRDQFLGKLDAFGVSLLPALGEPFDPQIHEAVSMAPVTDPEQAGLVVAVLKEGYAIGDELLRPASVVVAVHG
ncbi:MAG: nucleotide exchange factor GrpE [Vicinamibacterales bacterium]